MKGIILAGGSGSRLWNVTKAVSKQLLPVYDKPMLMYPLSTLMLAGIRDIFVITTPEDNDSFKRLLFDGRDFGVKISYGIQAKPEGLAQAFLIAEDCGFLKEDEPCALVLGDNIFHGTGFTEKLNRAMWNARGYAEDSSILKNADGGRATIFGTPVKDPQRYGIVETDRRNGEILSIEEKPKEPKSNICVTGLYFYPAGITKIARSIKPSARGELEITSVNQAYLEMGKLRLENLGLGFAWLDTGTFDSLSEASNYVETIEKRTGTMVCCPEEIAFNKGWLTADELKKIGENLSKNEYGQYLLKLAEQK